MELAAEDSNAAPLLQAAMDDHMKAGPEKGVDRSC